MTEFVVTFPVGGVLRDCYTTIDAENEYQARLQIIEVYGRGDPEGHSGFGSVYPNTHQAGVERFGLTFIPFGVLHPREAAS